VGFGLHRARTEGTSHMGYGGLRNGHKEFGRRLPIPVQTILQFLLLGGAVATQIQEVQSRSAGGASAGEWHPLTRHRHGM
jgi:hypothetical protein